jgi:uncharacterized Tic20 family protein
MSETPPQQPTPEPPPVGYQPPVGQTPPPAYQAPPAAAGYPQPVVQPLTESDQRMWSMLAHLGGIILGFIAPLIVMLVQGEKSPFVRRHSVEALNFQITLIIGYVVSAILFLVIIGFLLFFVVWIVGIVLSIIAGLAANKGEEYRYPINIRLVK